MPLSTRQRFTRLTVGAFVLLLLLVAPAGAVASQQPPHSSSPSQPVASTAARAPASSAAGFPTSLQPNSTAAKNSTVGYFDGYWYDSTIHVTPGDGLNRSELHAYVARTMARDELILHRNFRSDVPVTTTSRSSFQGDQQNASSRTNGTHSKWNNDVWRATFIVGHDRDVSKVLAGFYGGQVQGYYAPSSNRIALVAPGNTTSFVDAPTLAHELTHAMQDQYYNTSQPKFQGRTQDQQLAVNGLLEGQANYVRDVYVHECQTGQWSCLARPGSRSSGSSSGARASGSSSGSTSAPSQLNYGVQWVVYFPYAKGPGYVNALRQQGGWAAVDRQFQHPPQNSATIIAHRSVPTTPIHVTDTARNGWQRYHGVGVDGTDSAGEATIYSMFWWQSYRYGASVVPPGSILTQGDPFDQFNYTSAPSSGWAGDTIVPYHRAGASSDGYVWVTQWQTPRDARQFLAGYRTVLAAHNATKASGTDLWQVPQSDPYAGTYRVVENGTRVTIVEGPTPEAVADIRPDLAGAGSSAGPGASSAGQTTSSRAPGFDVVAALAALLLAGALFVFARRR